MWAKDASRPGYPSGVPYEVHLDVYTGPFDLLLHLITSQEVDLYEVSLVQIVDAYLAEIERMEELDLESATEFLLIAATLVELKCKRLLPGSDDVDLDEDLALLEARDYLLARLVEAKMFSEAGRSLRALELAASRSHPRVLGADERFAGLEPDLLASVTPERLRELAEAAFREIPAEVVETSHVHADEVSVHDTFHRLVAELPERGRTTLAELARDAPTTAAFVAVFLALLEMYKQSLVDLDQLEAFGEVAISWTGGGRRPVSAHDEYDELATPRQR